jgi:hypothetical protein
MKIDMVTGRNVLLNVTEGKRKVIPMLFLTEHHALKAYWGSEVIDPRILFLGTRWR